MKPFQVGFFFFYIYMADEPFNLRIAFQLKFNILFKFQIELFLEISNLNLL